jgi:hypothetical protein
LLSVATTRDKSVLAHVLEPDGTESLQYTEDGRALER